MESGPNLTGRYARIAEARMWSAPVQTNLGLRTRHGRGVAWEAAVYCFHVRHLRAISLICATPAGLREFNMCLFDRSVRSNPAVGPSGPSEWRMTKACHAALSSQK